MMRFIISTTLLFLSFSLFAQSENYKFSRLDIYDGLSHNQVNGILKDPDGFLWFGTMSGLNRYDGYSFKIFRNKHGDSSSLCNNYIHSLSELPGGKIWVMTTTIPCIYDSHTEKFNADTGNYLHSLGLPSAAVINIVKGNNGRYWFLYDSLGLYLYSSLEKKGKKFRQNFKFHPSEKITSINETKDRKLWVVYQNGFLEQYDIKSNKTIFSSTALQNLYKENNSYNLLVDNDGDVWLWYFRYGVFLFHPQNNSIKQFNVSSFPSKLNSNLVSQVAQDNNGLIWVATDHGGVNLIDKKNNFKTSYLINDPKDPKSISQNVS